PRHGRLMRIFDCPQTVDSSRLLVRGDSECYSDLSPTIAQAAAECAKSIQSSTLSFCSDES
ncbi:MAG TPA: hypothetical protein VGU90_09725, partial [Terriglobales bacterium]|nr:hypothetical protein [Terriglobales bacterium]